MMNHITLTYTAPEMSLSLALFVNSHNILPHIQHHQCFPDPPPFPHLPSLRTDELIKSINVRALMDLLTHNHPIKL